MTIENASPNYIINSHWENSSEEPLPKYCKIIQTAGWKNMFLVILNLFIFIERYINTPSESFINKNQLIYRRKNVEIFPRFWHPISMNLIKGYFIVENRHFSTSLSLFLLKIHGCQTGINTNLPIFFII